MKRLKLNKEETFPMVTKRLENLYVYVLPQRRQTFSSILSPPPTALQINLILFCCGKPSFNIFVICRQAIVSCFIRNYHAAYITTTLHREIPCYIQNYRSAYRITVLHT